MDLGIDFGTLEPHTVKEFRPKSDQNHLKN